MSCRFCRERLSAYLDSELCDQEKGEVQSHLECCAACQVEYRALRETKQALASLGARVSREEIERLLQTDVGEAVRRYASMPVSPRTVTAVRAAVEPPFRRERIFSCLLMRYQEVRPSRCFLLHLVVLGRARLVSPYPIAIA
jgi:anti-sigma factor RsiW